MRRFRFQKKVGKSKKERGVALLITLFAVMIMTFLALEIAYNSHVELAVGASQVDRLKAYYLAKSGVQFSLLRIKVYQTALQKFGGQLGAQKSMLDMIWQLPFSWPPLLPPELSSFDKDNINKAVKKSFIDGVFQTQIESEGSKIDVNDLASPSEALKKTVNAQLVQLLQNRIALDDQWARDHRNLRPQELVNNIADWVSADPNSLNGGSKASQYGGTEPPIVPASRPMKTIEELHMVKGITDDIYKLLVPKLTVYGTKGINVNAASADILQSIDKLITKDLSDQIIARRNDSTKGPFSDLNDFTTFLKSTGMNIENFNKNPVMPLLFDSEFNFRIKSTGIWKHAQREIIAIVYDFDKVKGQLASQLTTPTPPPGGAVTTTTLPNNKGAPTPTPAATPPPGGPNKGPPAIVFWQEF